MSRPLARKLLRDLVHLRGQFAAVALVVAAGVALFVTLRSMHGYLLDARDGYYAQYRFAHVFAQLERAPEGLAAEVAALPGVAAVATRVVADVLVDVPGLDEPATGRLVSIPERRAPMLDDLHLVAGRWVEPGRRGEVIASAAFARANGLAPGDSVGAVIHGRWQRLRIVGTAISPEYVYEIRGGGDIFPDNRRFGVLWMGRPALAAAFDLEGAFNDLAVGLGPGASERSVVAGIDRLLDRYGGLGAYGREDHPSHRFLSDEIAETRVTSVAIPVIFLGVTAFLLHLVLGRLVGTQRDQIGVLKAFGYGNATVARHFLGMALVPIGAGAVAGVGLGLWFAGGLAGIYARFFQFPDATFHPDWWIVALGVGVAAGAALVGALGAVRRAVRLAPAEAMRPESPPVFRPSLLERSGLGRRLPLSLRIIVRHLHRRPWKAALSVLALALAVAIVFTGRFFYDGVEVLEQVQFEQVQRQDLIVTFRRPLPPAVGHELARLPGVLRVEPFRAAAAEVRATAVDADRPGGPPRVRRVAVMALDPDAELWALVDRHGRRHRLSASGVLMTTALADRLGVEPGDTVTVELLEGRRLVRRVRVGAVVDELIGSTIYLDRAAAGHLLREGERWSGAWLRIDPTREAELLALLERRPAVVAVAVRRSIVESFQATIAESFLIGIVSLIAFASVIAFGIVYNGARIALSERGRELASLRVLGFYRREVAAMLLGEQGLLAAAAVPLGFALGIGLCAVLALRFATDLFRIPFVVRPGTLLFATAVVGAAALVSALAVRRRVYRLDLIAVLKTRE